MKVGKFASIALGIMLLLFTVSSPVRAAQSVNALSKDANLPKKTLRVALRAYEAALRPDLPEEVAASGTFQAVRFKLAYPDLNYAKIVSALLRLSLHAKTPDVRHNAQIAACVISNAEAYLNAEETTYLYEFTEETREQFFAFLNAKVMASFDN